MITDSLYSILFANAAVLALVNDRIYPSVAEQDAPLPHVVLIKIPGISIKSLSGKSNLAGTRFQVNCYAKTDLGADELNEAVRKALDDYKGTVAGVRIDGIFPLDSGEGFYDSDTELFGVATDYRVWHNVSTS